MLTLVTTRKLSDTERVSLYRVALETRRPYWVGTLDRDGLTVAAPRFKTLRRGREWVNAVFSLA